MNLRPGFRDCYTDAEWRERWLTEARAALLHARYGRLNPDPRFEGYRKPGFWSAYWLGCAARARAMVAR